MFLCRHGGKDEKHMAKKDISPRWRSMRVTLSRGNAPRFISINSALPAVA